MNIKDINELKLAIINMLRQNPNSTERYHAVEYVHKLEKSLGVEHHIKSKYGVHTISILKKEKGLYKTLETFTIDSPFSDKNIILLQDIAEYLSYLEGEKAKELLTKLDKQILLKVVLK